MSGKASAPTTFVGAHIADNRSIATPPPSKPVPARGIRRGPVAAAIESIVPERNPAGAVYGLLAIGALLAAESGLHETYLDTVLSAVVAAGVYWLLHAYATVLGLRLAGERRLSAPVLGRALVHNTALLRGAAIPLTALVLAWVTGAAQATGVTVALWSAVAGLVVFEAAAGVRARAGARELALEAGIGLTMGLAVLGLKIILH
jgi:hypothetical protein